MTIGAPIGIGPALTRRALRSSSIHVENLAWQGAEATGTAGCPQTHAERGRANAVCPATLNVHTEVGPAGVLRAKIGRAPT